MHKKLYGKIILFSVFFISVFLFSQKQKKNVDYFYKIKNKDSFNRITKNIFTFKHPEWGIKGGAKELAKFRDAVAEINNIENRDLIYSAKEFDIPDLWKGNKFIFFSPAGRKGKVWHTQNPPENLERLEVASKITINKVSFALLPGKQEEDIWNKATFQYFSDGKVKEVSFTDAVLMTIQRDRTLYNAEKIRFNAEGKATHLVLDENYLITDENRFVKKDEFIEIGTKVRYAKFLKK